MTDLRIREIMDELNATGLSADQHALVTELVAVCFMASMGGMPQTPRQERNKRYYENKRLKASETVLIKTPDPSPSSPYDNKNSTPSNPILAPLPPKREDRAKRLPQDWQPSESLLSSKPIQKLGLPREVLSFETEAFRDHFLGNGRRMIEWDRAWSNWMREAKRRQSRFEPKGKSNVVAGSFRKELKPEPEGPKVSEEERQANLAKLATIKFGTKKL
jgi:hypothetical protein